MNADDPTNTPAGERHPGARLSEAQVAEIKRLLTRGAGYRFLAERFGVSRTTIGAIARGERWRHVPWPHLEKETRKR